MGNIIFSNNENFLDSKYDPKNYISARRFGVIADNSTDVSTQLQEAIDFAFDNNLGLDLPGGIIRATNLIIPVGSNNSDTPGLYLFSSAGKGMCTIKAPDNSFGDIFTTENFATATNSNNRALAAKQFTIKDITIDGNAENNIFDGTIAGINDSSLLFNHTNTSQGTNQGTARGFGLKLYGLNYLIQNVEIYNCPSVCFYSECGALPGAGNYGIRDFVAPFIKDCKFKNAGLASLIYRGPNDAKMVNVYCSNPASGEPSGANWNTTAVNQAVFEASDNYQCPGVQLLNFHCWGRCKTDGLVVRNEGSGVAQLKESIVEAESPDRSAGFCIRIETTGNVLQTWNYFSDYGIRINSNDNKIVMYNNGTSSTTSLTLGDTDKPSRHNIITMISPFVGLPINFVNSNYNHIKGIFHTDSTSKIYNGTPGTHDEFDLVIEGSKALEPVHLFRKKLPTTTSFTVNDNTGSDSTFNLPTGTWWNDGGTVKIV